MPLCLSSRGCVDIFFFTETALVQRWERHQLFQPLLLCFARVLHSRTGLVSISGTGCGLQQWIECLGQDGRVVCHGTLCQQPREGAGVTVGHHTKMYSGLVK